VRHLVPHYFISTRPLGWRCSECGQPFSLIGLSDISEDVPMSITVAFNAHTCRIGTRVYRPRSEEAAAD
jgi:hypothetical protein